MTTAISVVRAISRVRRPIRRLFVIAAFGGYPLVIAGYATLVEPGRLAPALWGPIAVLLMSLTIFGLFAVYAFARNRAQLDSADLDERQRMLGTRSYALSYTVLTMAVWAVVSAIALAVMFNGPVTITGDWVLPMIVLASVYLPALPAAVLAWIEPEYAEDGRS